MKKINIIIRTLCMFMLLTGSMVNAQSGDTSKTSNPSADQASPGTGPGKRQLLEDTGGKSGIQGKSDTANLINKPDNQPVKDISSSDKYFGTGAIILIAIVLIALAIRYRRNKGR